LLFSQLTNITQHHF